MAAFNPIAVARVSSMKELDGYADRISGGGVRRPTNTMVTVDGPLDARGMAHPAAVVAQQRMEAVLQNAAMHHDKVTAMELAAALAVAHADGTDTQLEGFAKRWLAAARRAHAAERKLEAAIPRKHNPANVRARCPPT